EQEAGVGGGGIDLHHLGECRQPGQAFVQGGGGGGGVQQQQVIVGQAAGQDRAVRVEDSYPTGLRDGTVRGEGLCQGGNAVAEQADLGEGAQVGQSHAGAGRGDLALRTGINQRQTPLGAVGEAAGAGGVPVLQRRAAEGCCLAHGMAFLP